MRDRETRYCDNDCGYKLPDEYGDDETTCGACLDETINNTQGEQS